MQKCIKYLLFGCGIACMVSLKSVALVPQRTSQTFQTESSDLFCRNGIQYRISHSPLTVFPEYKNLFPEIPLWELFLTGDDAFKQDKNYSVVWHLVNDTLYLSDVIFLFQGDDPWTKINRNEVYDRIEDLVHQHFDTTARVSQAQLSSHRGVIRADWVTDTLYVKPCQKRVEESQFDTNVDPAAQNTRYERLVFKRGVLTDRMILGSQQHTILKEMLSSSPPLKQELTPLSR